MEFGISEKDTRKSTGIPIVELYSTKTGLIANKRRKDVFKTKEKLLDRGLKQFRNPLGIKIIAKVPESKTFQASVKKKTYDMLFEEIRHLPFFCRQKKLKST